MRNLLHVFVNVFVFLVVLTTVRVFGQETFAPLIGGNTVAFVHLDLRKIEIDTIKSQAEKLGVDLLQHLHFDEKSLKATTRELKAELEKLDAFVRPQYETITKTLGIQELAVIADCNLLENNITAVLVVPLKDKTKDEAAILQSCSKTFLKMIFGHEVFISSVISGDFLLFPFLINNYNQQQQDEITKLTLIAWLQNMKPSKESLIQQGLQVLGQDEIKIVAALPENLKAILVSNTLPNDMSNDMLNEMPNEMPREIQGLFLFAAQKIEWAASSLSINALFSGENINNVLLTVKTPKRTDAVQLRGLMENAIEFGMNALRFSIEQEQSQKNVTPIPPLFFEFVKGMLRTLLPDIENDKLIFRLKGENVAVKQGIIASGGIVAALILPSVQAAREAGQRGQCVNKIKQIIIAFHNYHDVYQGLPPLYTVDTDGKPLHSWRVLILPFMEQAALYDRIRLNEPWDSEYNKQFHNIIIDIYRCSANPLAAQKNGLCCYSVIAGEGLTPAKEARTQKGKTLMQIADGTSNTLAIVEVKEPFCWMDPTADITLEELLKGINNKEGRVGSFHPYGINFGMFDGSVRPLSNNTSKEVLKALGTCNGHETVTVPY